MYYLIDTRTGFLYAKGSSVYWLLKDLGRNRNLTYRESWRPTYYEPLMRLLLHPIFPPAATWEELKSAIASITRYVVLVKAV